MKIGALVTLSVLMSCFCIPRATAYDGWMRLSMKEVQKQDWRDVAPKKFLSVGLDMDGDGKEDVAAIVVSLDLKRSAIRVCFGEMKRNGQCQIVAESDNISDVMGVERKGPGCYAYVEDDGGRPSQGEKICGKYDVLEYFKFGSASSFFVYDIKQNTFKRYWDSD